MERHLQVTRSSRYMDTVLAYGLVAAVLTAAMACVPLAEPAGEPQGLAFSSDAGQPDPLIARPSA